jgi:hypothetical protein
MSKAIHNNLSKVTKVSKDVLLTLIISGMFWASASANDNTQNDDSQSNPQTSARSIKVDYTGKAPKLAQGKYDKQKNDAQQGAVQVLNELASEKLERRTRDQVIAQRQQEFTTKAEAINQSTESLSNKNSYGRYLDFFIYSASSRLFDDIDYDGFFRTFGVIFDADVFGSYSGQRARVYADLYLSRNGGPWELYFTTENFTIIDDSSDDEFEVLTTLDAGYTAQYYDVLIDLYEVGYSDIVATISSEDVDALYALPLESADRDQYEQITSSTSVGISAGSSSVYALLLVFFVALIRTRSTASRQSLTQFWVSPKVEK